MSSDAAVSSKPAVSSCIQRTHYDVLRIPQTATPEEIKTAYRSLIISCHPDKVPLVPKNDKDGKSSKEDLYISEGLSAIDIDDEDEMCDDKDTTRTMQSTPKSDEIVQPIVPTNTNNEEEALTTNTTTFHQLQTAYQCLRDESKRRQYDETIRRNAERKEWKRKGALEVNLSEMECDWCCVIDEGDSDDEDSDEDAPLKKVYFHQCRCGDAFQILREELLESVLNGNTDVTPIINGVSSERVWQCESCSLKICINIDIKIDD